MVACAREKGLFLMEAVWTRFLPTMQKFMQLYRSGEFGKIQHIIGDFSYDAFSGGYDPKHRLFNPELGGGALMDVGTYVLYIGAMMLGEEQGWQSTAVLAPTGVDNRTLMQLQYAGGATAQYMVAMDVETPNNMTVFTEKAVVELPRFWCGNELIINGQKTEFPPENEGHYHEFNYVAEDLRAGRTESSIMPLDESLQLMQLMDAIRADIGVKYPTDC